MKALATEIFEQTKTYNSTQTSFPHEDTQTATHTHTQTKTYSHINLREETISRFLKASDLDTNLVKNFDVDNLNVNPDKSRSWLFQR